MPHVPLSLACLTFLFLSMMSSSFSTTQACITLDARNAAFLALRISPSSLTENRSPKPVYVCVWGVCAWCGERGAGGGREGGSEGGVQEGGAVKGCYQETVAVR